MADNRKTQGITKPIYEMKKVKRSGKTKYKQVSEQRGRRLIEKSAKENPSSDFNPDVMEFNINKSKSITRYGGPSQHMGAKMGETLSQIQRFGATVGNKAIESIGSPVSNKITPSSLIESTDIPAGEPGGYGYDETVSTPVEEMGKWQETTDVDIEDIHTIANEPPISTSLHRNPMSKTTVSPAIQEMGESYKQVGETTWKPLPENR
jgi:hypothetical protein